MNNDYGKLVVEVAGILSRQCGDDLSLYDFDGEPGAHRIAYSIVEIFESSENIIKLMDRLRGIRDGSTDISSEIIQDFRDEIEHMLYHVRDSGIFSDLLEMDRDEKPGS